MSHSTYRRSSSSLILSSALSGTMFGTKMPLRLSVIASNSPTARHFECLAEQLANHARWLAIDQTLFATGVLIHELLVIDAKFCLGSHSCLHFNMGRKPMDDIRVRKALAYGIDRNELVEFWGEEICVPAYTHMPPYAFSRRPYQEESMRMAFHGHMPPYRA